jgi:hypothetical protein
MAIDGADIDRAACAAARAARIVGDHKGSGQLLAAVIHGGLSDALIWDERRQS